MTRANCRWASGAVTDVSLPVQACRSHGRACSAMVDETCLRCCTGISSATTRALLCAEGATRWPVLTSRPAPRAASGLAAAQSASGPRDGLRPALELCGSPGRSVESRTARPAFAKTRYSGLTGHDDGRPDDDAGCAAGESQVFSEAWGLTRFGLAPLLLWLELRLSAGGGWVPENAAA